MNTTIKALCAGLLSLALGQTLNAQGITTEHGYRFINHTNKKGDKPKPGETVSVHVITFIADSLMGSTRMGGSAPREFKLFTPDKMPPRVPPLFDAVLLMSKGDSATIYQPIDSTIRPYVPAGLQAEKEVRYEIVLVDYTTQADMDKKAAEGKARLEKVKAQTEELAKNFREGKPDQNMKKTETGLQYIVHEMGKGAPVKKGDNVQSQYYGCLVDGTMFDNSFERGQALPFTAGIGQMIPGFDEGAQLLNHGGKATLFIPWQLAYGEEGTPGGPIPAKADLVFYIEIE